MQWNSEVEKSTGKLENSELDDDELKTLRGKLSEIREKARSAAGEIDLALEPLRDELEALGPEPAEDEPKELASIAEKRKLLNRRIAIMEGQRKEVELLLSLLEKTLKQLSAIRIDRFTQKTFARDVSALAPEIWRKGMADLVDEFIETRQQFNKWQSEKNSASI
nr:hypothetical protein [Methylomarinum sp. Ch1-1]MDP4521560.1 hypothetical protein [Methylomarinum sp. Ch1-1]